MTAAGILSWLQSTDRSGQADAVLYCSCELAAIAHSYLVNFS